VLLEPVVPLVDPEAEPLFESLAEPLGLLVEPALF
jgi:hypothetical protein